MSGDNDYSRIESLLRAALSRSSSSASPPEETWNAISSRIHSAQGQSTPRVRPVHLAALFAAAAVLVMVGAWAVFWRGPDEPGTSQIAASDTSVQVWNLGDGVWLSAGEELTTLASRPAGANPSATTWGIEPGPASELLAEALARLPSQEFTVSGSASPFAQSLQAMRFDSGVENLLENDGYRRLLDVRRFETGQECGGVPLVEVFRFESTPGNVIVEGTPSPTAWVAVWKCDIVDTSSGAVVGESYYGPSVATSLGRYAGPGDVTLRKESRPRSPIPVYDRAVWGTETEWRTAGDRLERKSALLTGEEEPAPEGEWVDIGPAFADAVTAVDWLLASQFYSPIRRPSGSLLLTPFDSVEFVDDGDLEPGLARIRGTRQEGPSGAETWDVVVNIETVLPESIRMATGDGDWEQSAEFEFTYP